MPLDPNRAPTRRLRLFLRDFRMVEANVSLAEGQSLTSWLTNRRSYVNLQDAQWAGSTDRVQHASLRVHQVLWAASVDQDIMLSGASNPPAPRSVEIQLEGGLLVRAGVSIGERQRLSDFLETQSPFLPLRAASLLRSGRPAKEVNVTLGDIVLNQEAIQAVWEFEAGETTREEVFSEGEPTSG